MQQSIVPVEKEPPSALLGLSPVILSAILFLISLVSPAFIFDQSSNRDPIHGLTLFIWGWFFIGAPDINGAFSWYANPLALFVLLLRHWGAGQRGESVRAVMIAIIVLVIWGLQLSSFGFHSWPIGIGPTRPIERFGVGFYLWNLSLFVATVYSIAPPIDHLIHRAKLWPAKTKKIVTAIAISLLPSPLLMAKISPLLNRVTLGVADDPQSLSLVLLGTGALLSLYALADTKWPLFAKVLSFPLLVFASAMASLASMVLFSPAIALLGLYAQSIIYIIAENPRV